MEPEKSMGRVHHGGATLTYLNHILNCKHITISNLHIIAPENSPNTDGIDISVSCYVNIHDSAVGTRDDCITIINGSSYINITNIACGPGHGIRYSVGSLGEHGAYDTAEAIHVRNCTFNGTQNGARIKTHYYNISFRWWMMVVDIRKILSVISDINEHIQGHPPVGTPLMVCTTGMSEPSHGLYDIHLLGSKTSVRLMKMFLSVLTDSNEIFQNKTPPSLPCAGAFSLPPFLLSSFPSPSLLSSFTSNSTLATKVQKPYGLDAIDGGATSGCCRSKRLGGYGYAKNISFKQIKLVAAKNPIIIDQHYCNGGHDCKNYTSAVSETDVSYSDFQRTSETEEAIKFDFSEPPGCINIVMDQINITSAVAGKEVHAFCINVNGTSNATVPVVPCLKK
ncbi:unnamed protein product [Malus baccata var. baccata]